MKSRQAVLQGEDFRALWERIRDKTTYRVQFDNEGLLAACIEAIKAPNFIITKTRLQWRKADLAIGRSGVEAMGTVTSAPATLDEGDIELPDILTDLQDKTQLTRRSIHRILVDSGRLDDFKRNPQQFIELAAEVINRSKRVALVDGIKYQRVGAEDHYAQQLFETEELVGYLKSMIDANKSVHEQVIYESGTECTFAEQLEMNEAIKVYAKLPRLVSGTHASRSLQPRLGGVGRAGRRRATLLRGRDEERAIHRRPARQGARENRMWEGALQGPGGAREAGEICRRP